MQRNHNANFQHVYKKKHTRNGAQKRRQNECDRERTITGESKTKALKQTRKYFVSALTSRLQAKAISEVVFLLLMFLVAFSFYCLFAMCAFTRPFTTYMNVDNFFFFSVPYFSLSSCSFCHFFFSLYAMPASSHAHNSLFLSVCIFYLSRYCSCLCCHHTLSLPQCNTWDFFPFCFIFII